MNLTSFKEIDFLNAVKALFLELKVPVNYVADEPATAKVEYLPRAIMQVHIGEN